MNVLFGYDWKDRDRPDLLSQMNEARDLVEQRNYAHAIVGYRVLLHEPAVEVYPLARAEILSNLGAALLARALDGDARHDADALLGEAIATLSVAVAFGTTIPTKSGAIAGTNLALAYFHRFLRAGDRIDLLAARVSLKAVHAAAIRTRDHSILRWVIDAHAMIDGEPMPS